mgnify:CR=1 FL=1
MCTLFIYGVNTWYLHKGLDMKVSTAGAIMLLSIDIHVLYFLNLFLS